MLRVSTIIPSYRRPDALANCLNALKQQTRLPDEVIVVVRNTDTDTWAFLQNFTAFPLALQVATVSTPGVIAAMNVGLAQAQGDILAFTDDDAAPHKDWLERMEAHFLANSQVGGVGGRDWVHQGEQILDRSCVVVGKVQWFGRVIGNHHLGVGNVREVDVLKGVNMGWRRGAIAGLQFDQRLRGSGAQVHFEVAFCLAVRRAGWSLLYDPEMAVNHYPAQRFDEDQRHSFNADALTNAVHNETLALLEHLPGMNKVAFAIWAIAIGSRDAFGLLQWLRFLPTQGRLAAQRWLAALRGRWQGWLTWNHSKGPPVNRESQETVNPSL